MWENEESWFFPELTKDQTRTILLGTQSGTFLVRTSANTADPVLSVQRSNKLLYFTLKKSENGESYAIEGLSFPKIHDFLIYYHTHPLQEDGLTLKSPANVKYFAKNKWAPSEELKKKMASVKSNLAESYNNDKGNLSLDLMSVSCGQILRLLKRKPLPSEIVYENNGDMNLWCMETEQGARGLVPSSCLLVYVPSEYGSFMQRQRNPDETDCITAPVATAGTNKAATSNSQLPSKTDTLMASPVPMLYSKPNLLNTGSPFSDRRLGVQSDATKATNTDVVEMPATFPAEAVAIADRNPNFYDRSQLRFKKGDVLVVAKPSTGVVCGVENPSLYGMSEASIKDQSGKKGLIPLFSAYIKWVPTDAN